MARVGLGGLGASLGIRCRSVYVQLLSRDSETNVRFPEYGLTNFRQAFRKINAVTVPKMVGVPKNDEEDAARGNQ